jgi:hypothetical protein
MSKKFMSVKSPRLLLINYKLKTHELIKIIQIEKWEIKGRKVFNASED